MRNSYQIPTNIKSISMSSSNGFQKSPKVGQHIKQMKIGAPPGTSHNVRIMLVGNNGKPGQHYKANIADL
jgi:hypothetical protein